jgi:regulator of replication initiation timing
MKTYKIDKDSEKLFNRFVKLNKNAHELCWRINEASAIVQNSDQVVTENDLKTFFAIVSNIQNTLQGISEELDDLYGDVGVYIDEREIK